jgi:hypothetical protein
MSTVSEPVTQPIARERSAPWWKASEPMWAGLAIISMWLAVLFVGLFGGEIVSINGTAGAGTSTTVPSVVAIVPFVLVATLFVARWGFARKA